jgi:DNA-binding beta-propeller fold protein YncE
MTGVATVVGNINTLGDLSAMAFDDGGTLYAIDTTGELLLTLNKSNAQIITSVPLSRPLGAVAGMDFHPDSDVLYVADGFTAGTDLLFTLDVNTGILTEVGPTGLANGLAGLEFVPEPATLALLLIGGLPLIRRRRAA